ncbi:uncharacterized protein LOC143530307 [Bidens hawaiensis]|uniref:uncharacterized protein LOC143530307 n=1 Tax=Bidens hawaiensis TaxID=980011 RepID=UPI004049CFB7
MTTDSSCSKQDSPSKSRYVVESQNSGGVSSLLQRWKGLAEDKNSNNNDSGPTFKDNKTDNASPSSPTNSDANLEIDKESLLRQFSCPLPSRDSKASNPGAAEKEKIRVVDIIKKLSREEELAASNVAGQGNQSLPLIRTNLHPEQIDREPKGIKGVKVSRHLVRGRHAFDTFLMQMEKDKHRELKWFVEHKVVSNFKHRGRIQSLLRFKLLRLGAEPKPEDKIHKFRVPKPLESNKGQDIMDMRFKERCNSRNEKGVMESRKDKRNDQKNIASEESLAATSTTTKEVEIKTKTKTTTNNRKQESQLKSGPMAPNQSTHVSTASCKVAVHQAKFVDSYSSPTKIKEDDHYKDNNDDDDNDNFYEDEGQFMSAKTSYDQIENRNRRMQALESFNDWMTSEYSQTHSELDENESYDMQLFDTNYDWISHISRPKSDWEDMRQARYEEMLEDQSSANGDIQRLLERKNVSSFLGSSLRDLIDQLMMSRIQQSQAQTEKQDLVVIKKAESRKELELQDGLVEMELIYEMRGHMEQLHHEITDLRKSIKSCLNMQVKLQHSFKQNAGAAASHAAADQRNDRKLSGIVQHNCSICYDAQVDSLLYRCGHMCTCFNCAMELKRTSEECPVCEAPILDVVKAMCS